MDRRLVFGEGYVCEIGKFAATNAPRLTANVIENWNVAMFFPWNLSVISAGNRSGSLHAFKKPDTDPDQFRIKDDECQQYELDQYERKNAPVKVTGCNGRWRNSF